MKRLFLASVFFLSSSLFGQESKTLTRIYDPIVIEGKKLSSLLGSAIDRLSLMKWKEDKFLPIPFQIDEKLENGEYAFEQGEKAKKDSNPDFDANDELVFLAIDTGDRAPQKTYPEGAEKGLEIEIIDPLNKNRAWVYLFCFCQKAPRSDFDYVRFEVDWKNKHKRVYSKDRFGYGLIMGSPTDAVYPDEFMVVLPDGKVMPDILDRQKIRGVIKTKFLFDIDFKFDVLTRSKLSAWTDGQVRIIYRSDGYLKLGFFKFSGKGYSIITYYPNCLIWPMHIEVPFSLAPFIKDFELAGYMDYNENVIPAYVYSESNPSPPKIILDGKTTQQEKSLDYTSECSWILGYKDYGATFNRLIFPEEWKMVKKTFFLRETLDRRAPPEDDHGEIAVGYRFENFEKVLALEATYYQIYYFLPKYEPDLEKELLNILDHLLQTEVKDF